MSEYVQVIIGEVSNYRAIYDQQINTVSIFDKTSYEELIHMSYEEWKLLTHPIYKEIRT
jgi:coenzyme F420-reducing hydrogenase alpha subunit